MTTKFLAALLILLSLRTFKSEATTSDEVFLVGRIEKFDQDFVFIKSDKQTYKIPMKYILYPKLNIHDEIRVAANLGLMKDWAIPGSFKELKR